MHKISDDEAENSIKTLLQWIGEDPDREGLVDTPKRVINSFKKYFSGYNEDPMQVLKKTFTKTYGYKEIILLKGIRLYSFCEHHIEPINAIAHIAYYPRNKIPITKSPS